jgi:hypothetical protein
MLEKILKGLLQLCLAGFLLCVGFVSLLHIMKPSTEPPVSADDINSACADNARNFIGSLKDGFDTREYWKPGIQPKILYSVSDYRFLKNGTFPDLKMAFNTFEVSSSTQTGIPIRKRWDVVLDPNSTSVEGKKCAIVNIRDTESDDPIIPDDEIKHQQLPTPISTPPAPSIQTTDDREFSCTMLGEYKYGMTLDDFSAVHYKNYSAAPACQTENGAAKCKGHIALGSIHGIADFLFDDNKLFSISGSFDPREFLTVKNVFIAKFGEPSGIGVCRDPALNVSSSCEDLAWSKYGSLIMLHENYDNNGEQFVIFPPINQKHDNSSCPVAFITKDK